MSGGGALSRFSLSGQVAIFLAADAARFVTGQTLAVDGGMSCW